MQILYDYQMFSNQKFGGITRYFCELIKNLPSEYQFNLSLLFSENQHLKENQSLLKKRNILPNKNFKGKYFIQKNLQAVNLYYSKYCISRGNFDLFHPTFYDNYFLSLLKKPFVITVHDLIAFKFKDSYQAELIKPQMECAIRKANRVIAISENTKKDIIETFNIHPEKIDVIHHGYIKTNSTKSINNYGKYILFVGHRGVHKNFITFVEAASKLLNREKDIRLICVGSPFTKEELELFSRLKITNQTIALNVDDSMLNTLYAEALVFVYPSLYEGFGMPILEAYANNCPVCLSNTSSLPEVAGEAGTYFNPYDKESILFAIEKVVYDSEYSTNMRIAGQNQLKKFSWAKAAQETSVSYQKAISS